MFTRQPRTLQTVYKTEEDRQSARILSTLIWASLSAFLFALVAGLYFNDWKLIAALLAGGFPLMVSLVLVRIGHLRASSLLFVVSGIGTVTMLATVGQGIRDIALVTYPIIFIFAGLTLERKLFRLCVGLGMAAVCWLGFGEINGWYVAKPFAGEIENWYLFIIAVIFVLIAALAVDLLAVNMRKNLELARQEIARRILADNSFQASEERYSEWKEFLPIPIFEVDTAGILVSFNHTALEAFRLTQEDKPVGMNVRQVFPPKELQRFEEGLARVIKGTAIPGQEFTFLRKDGSTFSALVYATSIIDKDITVGVRGALIDITDRKRTEQELQLQEERLRLALSSSKQGWFDLHLPTNSAEISPELAKMLGYEPGEFNASLQGWIDGVHPEDREAVLKVFQETLTSGEARSMEYRRQTKTGGWIWIRSVGKVAAFDAEHKPLRMIGTHTNVTESKNAAEALRKKELYQRALLDNFPFAVWLKDPESRFLTVNEGFVRTFGAHSVEDLIGKNDFDIAPRDMAEGYRADDREVMDSRRAKHIEEKILTGGNITWFETYKAPVTGENGELLGTVGFARDISERKQAERATQEAHERLLTVLDGLDAVVYVADMKTHELLFVNKAIKDNFGEVVGQQCWKALQAGMSGPCNFCTNGKLLEASGNPAGIYCWEFQNTVNGSWYDVHDRALRWVDGRIVRLEVAYNITERKRADVEIRKSEEYFRAIFEGSSVGKSLTLLDGKIHRTNKALADMLGYSVEEMQQLTVAQITHPDDVEETREYIRNLAAGKQSVCRFEKRFIHKKGTVVWADVSSTLLRDEQGAPLHLITTIVDITERKRAEEELQKSEMRLIEAQHITHIGSWELDLQSNKLIWSDEIFIMFEIDSSRFGASYDAFLAAIHPDDRERVNSAYTRSLETREPYEINHRLLMSDGRIKFVHEQCETRFSAEGKPLVSVGIVQDITERKQMEDSRRENEERYRTLFQQASEGIFYLSTDGNVLMVNEAFARMHGYGLEEMQGMRLQDLDTPESTLLMPDRMRRVMAGENIAFEVEHYHKDGHVIPFAVSTGLVSVGGKSIIQAFHRDISERKQAEKALRESEEKFKTLFNTADDAIFTMNHATFLDCNITTEKMFKCSREQIVGHSPIEFSPERQLDGSLSRQSAMEKIDAAFAGQPQIFEWLHTRLDGTPFNAEVSLNRVFLGGEFILQAIVRDVSERKHAEEEKGKLENQLRQAQKMEAIGTLAGGIAHDFNNILNVIIGYGSLIMNAIGEDKRVKEQMNEVLAAADRATVLTRRLLAFSRMQALDVKPININVLVLDLQKMLKRMISESIEIDLELAERPLIVLADASQIEQVLMNLAVNAKDAMPEGGRLAISTRLRELDDEYIAAYGYGKAGTYALITVADTGHGIDAETQKRIFEPFFTTKGIGEGTGLGLAITYGIVKQHGGFIKVYSESGHGTVFRIYLPLSEEAALQNKNLASLDSVQGGLETILVAEDAADIRRLTKIVLESFGYKVIIAEDGEDAIAKFRENKDKIKLAVIDMIMPKKSGTEVSEALRKEHPEIKILFVSGYTLDTLNRQKMIVAGIDFMHKPIVPQDLLKKVREILDR